MATNAKPVNTALVMMIAVRLAVAGSISLQLEV
jgi:hypothetical protein